MTHKMFAVLTIKASADDEERVIEGVASTPSVDRMGDVVEPEGAQIKTPLPLLWQHDKNQPIGTVEATKTTPDGITFRARLAKVTEPGALKDRLDEAWQTIKAGLVRGVSIGFRPLDYELMKNGGVLFKSWEMLELSAVTIPANADASINTVKQFDANPWRPPTSADSTTRTAPGAVASRAAVKAITSPGVAGNPLESKRMNTQEQIKQFEATRAAKDAARAAIMEKAATEGRTLEEAEGKEHDELVAEIKTIDEHLGRLRLADKANAASAQPVPAAAGGQPSGAVEIRTGAHITVARNLPKGTAFVRYVMALAGSHGNIVSAAARAGQKEWQDTPEVAEVLKAAVAVGTTTDPAWAGPLVSYQNMASEFIDLLRPATILGRVPNLRRVPFNIKIPAKTKSSTVGWVGEANPKPVSALAFSSLSLGSAKAAGIVVLSDELVRFSNPSAEATVRDDLIETMTEFLDVQFIDPAIAAVANVSPASITHGVTAIPASGTDADALRTDLAALYSQWLTNNLDPSKGVFITNPLVLLGIANLRNLNGAPEFPGVTMQGGTLDGLPVVASMSVPAGLLILVAPSEILLADDGGVTVDASREASVQMESSPTNPATTMVSLWQMNLVGVRAERYINWAPRRANAVSYISGAAYGTTPVVP